MVKRFFSAVVRFVVQEGNTPAGKAFEHGVVAAASVAVGAAVTAAVKGNLDLTAVSTIALGFVATVVAAGRAFLKATVQGA